MSKVSKLIFKPKQFVIDSWLIKSIASKIPQIKQDNSLNQSVQNLVVNDKVTEPNVTLQMHTSGYVYIPWIESHGDKLINSLQKEIKDEIYPLYLHYNIDKADIRKEINRFSKNDPLSFRKAIIGILARNKANIKAVILTLDWVTPMRLIASACNELGIKTILVPHEGVFADKQYYYKDIASGVDTPVSDLILCWGQQQANIFINRGYPKERIKVVGSLKLASYTDFTPSLEATDFFKIFSLDENIFTMLFVCQPLDSQFDVKKARNVQRAIILDLIQYVKVNNIQLIIRKPPSGDRVLTKEIDLLIASLPNIVIDKLPNYIVTPEEAVYHSSVVLSINSTMLFEALLCNTPAISTKYIEFTQQWSHLNIPAPSSQKSLFRELDSLIKSDSDYWKNISFDWAKEQLSCGSLSYNVVIKNIKDILDKELNFDSILNIPIYDSDYFVENKRFTLSLNNKISNTNKYLPAMIGVRSIDNYTAQKKTLGVDTFINWGVSESKSKQLQKRQAMTLGKPLIYVEDGFLRSKNIGLSGESGLSIILDSKTAYYDARKASQLEDLLNSKIQLTNKQEIRVTNLINEIAQYRLSKYNHAPDVKLEIGNKHSKKILLIDQRFGDMSVEAGLADETSFQNMLLNAINDYPEYEILIKRHPDAVSGGKSSYFNDSNVGFTKHLNRVYLIDYEVNPHSLFDIVDKVFCVTSGMGFEALIQGKEVHTYGMPFYAGWGVTIDQLESERRTAKRSINDIFHFSYIICSRYYDPINKKGGEIEQVINYLKI
jgi:hypothetical protein